jgi:hypothetical protein
LPIGRGSAHDRDSASAPDDVPDPAPIHGGLPKKEDNRVFNIETAAGLPYPEERWIRNPWAAFKTHLPMKESKS